MERDEGKKMDHITLFTDILPEEQERMRVCFHAREMTFRNGETIMEYSNSMKKIGLILYGRAILYCCDTEGNEYMIRLVYLSSACHIPQAGFPYP